MSVPHQVLPFYAGEAFQPGDLNLFAQGFSITDLGGDPSGWFPLLAALAPLYYSGRAIGVFAGSRIYAAGPALAESQTAHKAFQGGWIGIRLGPTMKAMKLFAPRQRNE